MSNNRGNWMVVDIMRTRLLSGSNVKYGAAKGMITPKDTMTNKHPLFLSFKYFHTPDSSNENLFKE